jgi:hypothetical protein
MRASTRGRLRGDCAGGPLAVAWLVIDLARPDAPPRRSWVGFVNYV